MQINVHYISLLVMLLFGFTKLPAQQRNCDHEIAANILVVDGNAVQYNAGETICLKGSNKEYLLIQNVHGSAEEPITIVNENGAIIINTDHYYGIKIAHSSFIKVTGNGTDGIQYGFQVQRVSAGTGLAVGDLSSDVEIAYMEIANTPIAGVYAKTDPTCTDFSSTRDKFTMYNFKFHDCYVHDIADEGLYIGSSKYSGQHLTGTCDTLVYPHLLVGTSIFNNIIENAGWDGIQVSSAEHDCKVYNNTVRNDSQEEHPGQMSGILIGGGSRCEVFNNKIYDGKGDGIDVFGLGSLKLFNNLIVRAGKSYLPNSPTDFKHGIYIGKSVTAGDEDIKVYNNTIISPKSFGITFANDEVKKGFIINNTVINPGYTDAGDNAFINLNVPESMVDVSNTYSNSNIDAAGFVSVSEDNYDLKATSPLVDHGKELSSEGIVFDIDNRTRPFHTYTDIGAYECQDPTISVKENAFVSVTIFPNPADEGVTIIFDKVGSVKAVNVFTMQGKKASTSILPGNKKRLFLSTSTLANGVYSIEITYRDGKISYPLVVFHE